MGPGKATFRVPSQPAWPKGWYGAAFWVGGQRRSRRAPGKMRWVLARSGCGADRSGDRERSLWQGLQAASGDKHTVTPEGVVMNRLSDKAGGPEPTQRVGGGHGEVGTGGLLPWGRRGRGQSRGAGNLEGPRVRSPRFVPWLLPPLAPTPSPSRTV